MINIASIYDTHYVVIKIIKKSKKNNNNNVIGCMILIDLHYEHLSLHYNGLAENEYKSSPKTKPLN